MLDKSRATQRRQASHVNSNNLDDSTSSLLTEQQQQQQQQHQQQQQRALVRNLKLNFIIYLSVSLILYCTLKNSDFSINLLSSKCHWNKTNYKSVCILISEERWLKTDARIFIRLVTCKSFIYLKTPLRVSQYNNECNSTLVNFLRNIFFIMPS